MSKRQWLSLLGVWVMVFLFLGFPSAWHKIIAIASGLIIVAISYNLPAERRDQISSNSSFIENKLKDDAKAEMKKEIKNEIKFEEKNEIVADEIVNNTLSEIKG